MNDTSRHAELKVYSHAPREECPSRSECQLDFLDRMSERLQPIEDRLKNVEGLLRDALKRPAESDAPPDSVQIKKGGVRVQAPVWVTIVLMVFALAIVAVWQIDDLAKILAGK